ncbi:MULTISPECIES: ATP-dependent DNA helicase [Arthrobacter]|uniref:DNA 3'-5' helicase n=2 Tax=Arthrobacter TaxID=1663 RepID=A0ABU9KLB9_9MICC|nr:ATP-dependent DNA helicase [Arthrobacter sp. YJM1]MDP5227185.1 ATP-dependent DNA helicase [Arthrobacter sp. YJM1]
MTEQQTATRPSRPRGTAPRLLPPVKAGGSAPSLSPDQDAVVNLPHGSGPVMLWGAPGTGKSTTLVEAAVRRVESGEVDPERVLVLAPSRSAASSLRDRLTSRLGRSLGTTPARSWSSYAFDVIRRAHVEGVLLLDGPPRLLSGPEQDQVIKDLLAGGARNWPRDLEAALATRGFRQEIRELFDRLIEHDGDADDLESLSARLDRPEWEAASRFYREYRDVMDLRNSGAFDPAGIITAARQVFALSPEFLAAERERLQLILVDDLHEASWSVYELFLDLAMGKDVLATVCPDTAVQGFRGARPDLVARIGEQLGGERGEALSMELTTAHRLPGAVAEAYGRAAGRIPPGSGGSRARVLTQPRAVASGVGAEPGVETHEPEAVTAQVFRGGGHELRHLGSRIQGEHLRHGRSLEDMAVIVRNGGEVARVQRYLLARGIPVRVALGETPVRDELAVRPLLDVLGVVLGQNPLDVEQAVGLLTSRVGGASSLDVRRLRQRLRQEERTAGGVRGSDELLVEALADPVWLDSLGLVGRHAQRIARMLGAGRSAALAAAANGETVLWGIWKASDLSAQWAETALESGPAGARADRDLDAVMALFESAERFATQFPGSGAGQFYDYLTSQELPMDTLTARPPVEEAVEILTPAGAAGREWPVVFIAGIQEGVWPNTRLRGELLGNTLLADALEHGPEVALQQGPGERLKAVRTDELRTFAAALSRASEHLVLSAVDDGESRPSAFLELAVPGSSEGVISEPGHAMDLRSLVSELRRAAEEHHAHPGQEGTDTERAAQADDAAAVLALLAGRGVPGAHPEQWWGLLPSSSDDDLIPDGGTVVVSPSKVEKAVKSPLEWFVPAAGGEAHTDFARSLGTLIHAIAAELPDGTLDAYLALLDKRWPELGLPEGWENDALRRRAERMLFKLASYVASLKGERTLAAVEIDFTVDLSESLVAPGATGERTLRARIRGQIDRLEVDDAGHAFVVDLKTGKTPPPKAEIDQHAQLATYQEAINQGAFSGSDERHAELNAALTRSGGAALVQLGNDSTKGFNEQRQAALRPDDGWAMELVHEAAIAMAGREFEARHDAAGTSFHGCKTPEVCPLCHTGRQVTE